MTATELADRVLYTVPDDDHHPCRYAQDTGHDQADCTHPSGEAERTCPHVRALVELCPFFEARPTCDIARARIEPRGALL